MRARTTRGFTLVELMVVVVIIGILAGLAISMQGRTYGTNAKNTADQVVSILGMARMRAASTRHIQRVQVQPNQISIWQVTTAGLTLPVTPVWQQIEVLTIPRGVVVWNAQSSVQASPGATPVEDTALVYAIDFRPDGAATPSTLFLTDSGLSRKYRVLVYRVTGSSYAREAW